MNLNGIMLSEVSQSQKDKYHLHEAIRIGKFIWTELWLLPGLERRVNRKLLFNGYQVSVLQVSVIKFQRLIVMIQPCACT